MAVALAFLFLTGGTSVAQTPNMGLSLVAGPAPYDLAGTGTGAIVGLRGDLRPVPYLSGQIGLSCFKYTSGGQIGYDYLLPERTLAGRMPLGRVAPYLGAGLGLSVELEGQDDEALTLHGVVGLNVQLGRHVETVTEARLRSIDPWTGNTLDLVVGSGWRF